MASRSVRARVGALLVLVLTAGGGAGAQVSAGLHSGEWLVGGGAGFGRTHDGTVDEDITHVSLAPSGLVFVTDRLAVGGSVSLNYSTLTGGHSYAYGVGPSARYYFATAADSWLPFLSATVAPRWTQNQFTAISGGSSATITSTGHSVMADGSIGVARLLERHVGVTGEAYYTRSTNPGVSVANVPSAATYDVGLRFGFLILIH